MVDKKDNKIHTINCTKSFLESSDELDIYQLVAFRIMSGNGWYCTKTKDYYNDYKFIFCGYNMEFRLWGYWMDILKSLICIFSQLASIIILYYHSLTTNNKGWCDGTGALKSKIMATSYTLVLSIIFIGTYIRNQEAGFYIHLDYRKNEYNFISS